MRTLTIVGVACALAACAPPSTRNEAAAAPSARVPSSTAKVTAASPWTATSLGFSGNRLAPDLLARRRAVPGEYLVKFRPKSSAAAIDSVLSKAGAVQAARGFRSLPTLRRVKLTADLSGQQSLAELGASPDVEYVEPNYIVHVASIPNDPLFATQWNMNHTGQVGGIVDSDIDAPEAWDITTGDNAVVIAIVDSGVDYDHEDLAANIWRNTVECTPNGVDDDGNGYVDDCHGIDTANGDSDPMDDEGHGTMVAGVIGAVGNNGIGVAGVAWNVRLLPCKFIGPDGDGSTADAIACLDYIAALRARGVNIVASNNSWGSDMPSHALADAVALQMQRGILFVTAAGNATVYPTTRGNNDLNPSYPCAFSTPNILCVAALNNGGYLTSFSSYGRSTVHIGAPGEDVPTTAPGNAYENFTGSSAAAPHVAGVLALLKAQTPTRDWRALKNLVLSTGVQTIDRTIAGMQLNAHDALTCTNSVKQRRILPVFVPYDSTPITMAIGAELPLSVLHVRCAAPNGDVTISVSPGGDTVTLRDDGLGKDAASGDGIYSGAWVPSAAGVFTLDFPDGDAVPVTVDDMFKPGFPVKTWYAGGLSIGSTNIYPSVGNIDADPKLEIVMSGVYAGPVYAWHSDGTLVRGWPALEGWTGGTGYPVLGEFAPQIPGLEVFVDYPENFSAVYSGNGVPVPPWPRPVYGGGASIAYDFDHDGIDEIGFGGVVHPDGQFLNANFGPNIDGHNSAIGDLDGDENAEVFTLYAPSGVSQGIQFSAGHSDGTPVDGFVAGYTSTTSDTYPVMGDVDGDGAAEIIITTVEEYPWIPTIRELDGKGNVKRSWSVPNTLGGPNIGTRLALGDLDGDGIPEIVVQTSQVDVFKGDGSRLPGWPQSNGDFGPQDSAPVIGDVTGDGLPDVVVCGSPFKVFVWNANGTPVSGFPKTIPRMWIAAVPAIADLDLDGRNDIILTRNWNGEDFNSAIGYFDAVWVLDLRGPAAHGPIEWGQLKGGRGHDGFYELGKNLANDAYLATQVRGGGTVTGTGINCGVDCIERVAKGTNVTLSATPVAGESFIRWLGACAGQANPCTVRVDRYRSTVAEFNFLDVLTVTLGGSGAGVVTSAAGINCPADCTKSLGRGTTVTLEALPAADSLFTGWSGACTGTSPSCTTTISGAAAITAMFTRKPHLVITRNGTGAGRVVSGGDPVIDCGVDCDEFVAPATIIQLFATAGANSYFSGWGGACNGTLDSCALIMNDAQKATATFELKPVLTVTRAGTGVGAVNSASGISCGADCEEILTVGSVVTLDAAPASGSNFTSWSGCTSVNGTSCSVTLDAAHTVTATFTVIPPSPPPGGGGNSGGGGGGGSLDWLLLGLAAGLAGGRLKRARA